MYSQQASKISIMKFYLKDEIFLKYFYYYTIEFLKCKWYEGKYFCVKQERTKKKCAIFGKKKLLRLNAHHTAIKQRVFSSKFVDFVLFIWKIFLCMYVYKTDILPHCIMLATSLFFIMFFCDKCQHEVSFFNFFFTIKIQSLTKLKKKTSIKQKT